MKSRIKISKERVNQLLILWNTEKIGVILKFCSEKKIIQSLEKLREHLERNPRSEAFNEDIHSQDKGDWLADSLFQMVPESIEHYAEFLNSDTAYSTQHGVKGEEYAKVLVVYDDIEAAWNAYSFNKTLTPIKSEAPPERQRAITQKLAYVLFSRATEDLRVVLFIANPEAARIELIERKLLLVQNV